MRFYTVSELAKEFGCGRTLIQRLVAEGDIPSYRIGKNIRIPVDGVEQYLSSVAHGAWRMEKKEEACA